MRGGPDGSGAGSDRGVMGFGLGMGGGAFMGILLILVLVAVVVWFARSGDLARWAGQRGAPTSDSALETLRHRYARGEIDAEEFERRKADLA